jgi:hypothetical protein
MADHLADERADQEHGHRKVEHQPTADVAARAAEARAVLPPRRSAAGLHPRLHDPDRLAAARAEIASREIIPVPAERLEQTPAGPT